MSKLFFPDLYIFCVAEFDSKLVVENKSRISKTVNKVENLFAGQSALPNSVFFQWRVDFVIIRLKDAF